MANNTVKAYKNCPFCGEEILESAIKCKHCREFLPEKPPQNETASVVVDKKQGFLPRSMNAGYLAAVFIGVLVTIGIGGIITLLLSKAWNSASPYPPAEMEYGLAEGLDVQFIEPINVDRGVRVKLTNNTDQVKDLCLLVYILQKNCDSFGNGCFDTKFYPEDFEHDKAPCSVIVPPHTSKTITFKVGRSDVGAIERLYVKLYEVSDQGYDIEDEIKVWNYTK